MDKDVEDLRRAEKKALEECKKLAKQHQLGASKILAKEIVRTRKAIERNMTAKAQMNSVSMALQSSVALLKIQGVMSKSTDVMKAMSQLISLPEMTATMAAMAREMERAGLVEDMVADAFALTGGAIRQRPYLLIKLRTSLNLCTSYHILEPDDLDMEADVEVNKVIEEITSELLAPAGMVPTKAIARPQASQAAGVDEDPVDTAAMDADLSAMQARLGTL